MAKPQYVRFEVPKDLQDKVLSNLEVASTSGKIRKGTNEVTKAIERNEAKLVIIAEDVNPPEVVAHLPYLCDEKNVPYVYVPSKGELGQRVGITSAASVAIIDFGKSESEFKGIIEEISKLKK